VSEEDDRPRRTWAEIDKLRDRPRARTEERRPRGKAAEARARSATGQYLKKLDRTLFARGGQGGGAGEPHAKGVLDALGSPGLDDACRSYLNDVGPPREAALISAFLDARDRGVRIAGLRALEEALAAGSIEPSAGLRRQVRMLADDLDDALAEAAEDALARMDA
jgi:hypothetical protein